MERKILFILILLTLPLLGDAATPQSSLSCPVSRYIGFSDAEGMVNTFRGDTILLSVPNAEDAVFQTFKYLTPDTIWLKERQLNKPPQEHKHFELHTNFKGAPGWGVNAHREYTYGRSLEGNLFILRDFVIDEIPYLGKFPLIILEDVNSGKFIKWEFRKNENEGIVIVSPSIKRHLDIIIGNELYVEQKDSTASLGKCTDVGYSIRLHNKQFFPCLILDFDIEGKRISTTNWIPRYFLRKEYESKVLNQN